MKQRRFIVLSATLLVLIVITLIATLSEDKKAAGNFSSSLVDLDPGKVSVITFTPPGGSGAFELVKAEGGEWKLVTAGKEYVAGERQVDQLLGSIGDITATQVVARDSDAWGEYHVNDSLGTQLALKEGGDQLASLVVGRISFSQSRNPYQQQPDMFTFLRQGSDATVYKVKGMLSMQVSGGVNSFRSGVITDMPKAVLQEAVFSYPADSSYVLTRRDSIWDMGGMQPDSASLATYLTNLTGFSSRSFVDTGVPTGAPAFSIQLKGTDMASVEVRAWTAEEQHLVTSSQNPGSVFRLEEEQFERLFRGKGWLSR